MNPSPRNPFAPGAVSAFGPGSVESTLRFVANLPAPQGLEDRVQAALLAASVPAPQAARVLAWPTASKRKYTWMRAAAAAAIVFVVAGGGWGIYSRVQPAQQAGAPVLPAHIATPPAGFSSAGAMRTPQTLNGPRAPRPAAIAVKTPEKSGVKAAERRKSVTKKKAIAQHVPDSAR